MNISKYSIILPQTDEEFIAYYHLRWEVLRKPWNQPMGSEKDEDETTSNHRMLIDENLMPLAVGRLQFNDNIEAQIRYMAVHPQAQGKGLGYKMMLELESIAINGNCSRIILQSREHAVQFYKKCGYSLIDKTYLLFDQIQHYLMAKTISVEL